MHSARRWASSICTVWRTPTAELVAAARDVEERLDGDVLRRGLHRRVLAAAVERGTGPPEDKLHVLFLADHPDPARVAALDANRSVPDEFAVHGREVYLYLPHGVGRTKLTNDYFDRGLGTTCTGRNWKTVMKLVEMCGRAE